MTKIAVVGSGLIGRAWAITFARGGYDVALYDREDGAPAAAVRYIDGVLPSLAEFDLLQGQEPATVLGRIAIAASLAEALEGAGHVQENTPENVEIKHGVFSELERLAAPDTILASSTSAILPSAFSEHLKTRERCLVAHPINPPYLVPAVEVVPSPWTDPDACERTATLLRGAGQSPIVMKTEIDGFVMNRMQGALLDEAFRLVHDGYATPEDVDIGIREGLALRWSFMGPFETIDLNAPQGVRDYVERYKGIYEAIGPSQQRRVDWAGPVLDAIEADRRARLSADKLGDRQAWRDRRLMALAAHKRQSDRDIKS